MQIGTTLRFYITLVNKATIREKKRTINSDKVMGKEQPLFTIDVTVN